MTQSEYEQQYKHKFNVYVDSAGAYQIDRCHQGTYKIQPAYLKVNTEKEPKQNAIEVFNKEYEQDKKDIEDYHALVTRVVNLKSDYRIKTNRNADTIKLTKDDIELCYKMIKFPVGSIPTKTFLGLTIEIQPE